METHVAGTESVHQNAHPFQRLYIQHIQATATIHQDFGQSRGFDNWVDHQSLPPRGGNVRWVIGLVECHVKTPIPSHIDLAVTPHIALRPHARYPHGCHLTMTGGRLRLLAHVYDSVASIHMTKNPGRHD